MCYATLLASQTSYVISALLDVPLSRLTMHAERLTETSNDQLHLVMNVNLFGPFYLMKAVIPHFLAKPGEATGQGTTAKLPKKGTIVNVCSVAAVHGAVAGASYTASKHALLGLSKNTAWMYHRDGIKCNVVLPGSVNTNIMSNSGGGDHGQFVDPIGGAIAGQAHQYMPLVTAEDIARAILYLAGAESVNGAQLGVDQGWMAS